MEDEDKLFLNKIKDYLISRQFELYEKFKSCTLWDGDIFMNNGFWRDIDLITTKHYNNTAKYYVKYYEKLKNKEFNLDLITFKYIEKINNRSQVEITENK